MVNDLSKGLTSIMSKIIFFARQWVLLGCLVLGWVPNYIVYNLGAQLATGENMLVSIPVYFAWVSLFILIELCPPNPEGGGYVVFGVDPVGISIGVHFSFLCIIFWTSHCELGRVD